MRIRNKLWFLVVFFWIFFSDSFLVGGENLADKNDIKNLVRLGQIRVAGRLLFLYGDESQYPAIVVSIRNLGDEAVNIPLEKIKESDEYFSVIDLKTGKETAKSPHHFPLVEEPPSAATKIKCRVS